MKILFTLLSFSVLASCSISAEDTEKQRDETLQYFEEKKRNIEQEIKELKESATIATEDAKKETERTLKNLEKEKLRIEKETEDLKKASKKELKKALEKAKEEFEDLIK